MIVWSVGFMTLLIMVVYNSMLVIPCMDRCIWEKSLYVDLHGV